MTPTPHPSLYPDWTNHMSHAEIHLKAATTAFLLRDWERGSEEMARAKHFMDRIGDWLLKREVFDGK